MPDATITGFGNSIVPTRTRRSTGEASDGDEAVRLGIRDVEPAVIVLADGHAGLAHARDFEHKQAMDERDPAVDVRVERGAHQQVTVMPVR